jgi:hypothetical protein
MLIELPVLVGQMVVDKPLADSFDLITHTQPPLNLLFALVKRRVCG